MAAATTETDAVVANPNGSLSLTRSVAPLRTQRDGTWVDLDATLVKAADGMLRPKATTNGLTLSGGGTVPLATLEQDGKQLVLSWPEPLPTPVLEGESALYREVVPGTDLKVTADKAGGISQILVVKSAEAAKHPKLAKLTTGLKGEGVTVSADGQGNLKAADASGRTVFRAPAPTMWDSTAPVRAPLSKPSSSTAFSQAAKGRGSAPTGADEEPARPVSGTDGPGDFAKVAPLRADLGKDSLALAPDQAFLTDPATAYPVYIDPAWQPTSRGTQHWAWVQEAYPGANNYDDYNDTYDPGVGYQRWRARTGLERYYVQVDTSDLGDKSLRKASFFATQSYAADATCSRTYDVDLHSTGELPSNITWDTQPRDWEVLRTTSINSAGGPGCPGSTSRGEWDVLNHLAANYWRGNLTYGLFASNESKSGSNNSFKRFTRNKNDLPFLYVEYNRRPYDPWALGTFPAPQNPSGTGCGWVGATNYAGLSIGAWIGDPDGQTNAARFLVNDTADSSLAFDSGWIGSAAGTHWVAAHPTYLVDGHTYSWQVQSGDGDMASNWVTGCSFTMDTQPPSVPVVTSAEYPPSGTLPGSAQHIGQPGTFTVKSTDSLSGVTSYEWSLNGTIPVGGAQQVEAAADGSATLKLTPTTWGTNVLRVQSVDRAGNRSQQHTYAFYVPDNPNAKTTLGDITGDERVDFIAPTDNGDLVVYPTAVDPAAGGVIASNVANSPGGKGWGPGTLTTHRGGNGIRIDDLWTYRDGELTLYRNSLTKGGLEANGGLYYNRTNAAGVPRPYTQDCKVAATGRPCGAEYVENWTRVKQILAVGDALPETGATPRNDLLTVENDGTNSSLVLFQGTGATGELRDPLVLVLSPTGWDNLTLIAPGDATGDGLPDLWARDGTTGDVYQYANVAGNPAALGDHTKRTKIASGLQGATHPVVGSSGDTSADGIPDLWALDSLHRLRTWDGTATTGKVTGFGNGRTMGDARISGSHWKLDEGAGSAAADLRRRNNATLSATGATWANDTVAGTATKVLALDGNSGSVTATGPGVDTTRSFTVSAWAKSEKPSVVLSQDGQHASGFMLWHDADGTWRFAMSVKDDDDWAYDQTITMNEVAKVKTGAWTQLTATYDATTGLIALYVNGTLAGTGHHAKTSAWNATGPLVLGRYKHRSLPSSYFEGKISNVAVYSHSTVPTTAGAGTKLVSALSSAKCADNNGGNNADGNRIQIWDCSSTDQDTAQRFEVTANGELRVGGKCVDVAGGGTANGTPVLLWTCATGAYNQQWLPTATGGFFNPTANRCLDVPSARLDNGTQLHIWDCMGNNNQRWHTPGLATPLAG
ncbi:ricin-type beta-trefoil lectin domain protein [Streptomyces sp. NBC_01214]|uniref:ricin-type beta-trefoil lectin domain protein n=1 Tax=Streptomyces sp. NBC_01214 TaxID=2903777 RepID=UPI00225305EF|nr:ricin-type beta-trefoil lectin domain protein [Streptomyces sp. NBC_01214]MCX4800978.1 ricin-type beta-trefoil lectin domain protein [Streptomyces sp. NBC_01214]